MISIDGTKLPNPTKYNVGMSDLDSPDTTRNEAGMLIRNRVRQGVTKIELEFKLKGKDLASVLSLIEPAQVQVEYFDPRVFEPRTIKAYVGDRNTNMIAYNGQCAVEEIIWNVSFNLIEY